MTKAASRSPTRPGVGKTQPAVTLERGSIPRGYSPLFVLVIVMVVQLARTKVLKEIFGLLGQAQAAESGKAGACRLTVRGKSGTPVLSNRMHVL